MLDEALTLSHNTENNSVNDPGSDLLPNQEEPSSGNSTSTRKEKNPPFLEDYLKSLESVETVEAKIECSLSFMEKAIAQEKSADFKGFWDVRMKCLELFKENVTPFLRHKLWTKFSDLSKEARRLKDILDEQSNFASEQIDMAISAIENGLDQIKEMINKAPTLHLDHHAYALKGNLDLYISAQEELNQLNLFASRITSLRKELIKTNMRVRTKNKFFLRMSKAGDRVFPRRKALIQEISQSFSNDIEKFIQNHFGSAESRLSVFDLREEIKALQSAAKILTLNTQSFGKTRLELSECWDKLKEKDKERKEEFDKKKVQDEEKLKQDELRVQQKKELFEFFNLKTQKLLERAQELSADDLIQERDLVLDEVQKSALSKTEKNELNKTLKSLKESLRKKREESLLSLPDDERQALEQLKQLLAEKLEHRQEIKERLEQYRKILGSSGLSFEKSMDYNTRAAEEKEAYEIAQNAVREIEKKIESLEMNLS